MSRIFVKPAQPGLRVPRDYDVAPPFAAGQTIAESGEWVDLTQYIARRIRGGDLVEARPDDSKPESAAPPAAVTPKAAKRSAEKPTATE